MSVVSYGVGDIFQASVYKHFVGLTNPSWVNTYQFRAKESGDETQLQNVATALAQFEEVLHFDNSQIDRVVFSTSLPDSRPYNPSTFFSMPIGTVCARAVPVGQMALPLKMALYVKRTVAYGRYGKLEYRNVLVDNEVQYVNGEIRLASPNFQTSRIVGALTTSGLQDYLDGTNEHLEMVLKSHNALEARLVNTFQAITANYVKHDHKYFRKTPRISV